MQHQPQDTYRVTRFTDKRSVTETLLETLGQTGLRPTFPEAASSRRARAGQMAAGGLMLFALAALGFALLRPVAGSAEADQVALLEVVRGSVWRDPVWRDPSGGSGAALSGGSGAALSGASGAALSGGSGAALPASGGHHSSRLLTLTAGEPIHAGAIVETGVAVSGSANRASLRLAGGQSMRLDNGTRVRVASSSSVILERGAVYFDSAGAGLEVRTTLGVVRDIGTQFEVRLTSGSDADTTLRVRVREGSIVLESRGEAHHAMVGEELTLDRSGLRRSTIPINGPHWDWVLDTAPAPDVAAQPLQVFLDWVTREGGWTTRFADPATAEIAASTILHGDIRGLTPIEATEVVLSGSGLAYRLEADFLVIEQAGSTIAQR